MSRKSVSPKIGSPLGPVGSFFTSPKFLGSDRLGTQIAEVDRIANEAYQSVGLGCPGYEQQYTALLNLDKAAKLYAEMIEQMVRDQVEKDSDIFQKAQNSLTDVIYYRSVLNSELTDCLARHVYPEIGHVADGKNGNDTADDTYIRAKIRRSKLVQPCGFETFQDIAGGAAYEKYFEDYAIAPFELKNYNAEVTGTLGTMMYGPPGTGKTLFVKAVASKVASMGVAVYAINAAVIKGKYVGESEKSVQFLFEEARKDTNGGKRPVIIFIDEADGLLDEKSATNGGGTGVLAELNNQMQGVSNASNKGLIVMIATNYPENIPTAAVSRFTNKIPVLLPSAFDVREQLVKVFNGMGPARYNLDTGKTDMKEIDVLADGSLRKMLLTQDEKTKQFNGNFDALDVFSFLIADLRYAPREIDGLFAFMRGVTYGDSREFYRAKVPKGSRPTGGKDYVEFQRWILDETKYKTKVVTGDPRNRSCKVEEDTKHMLIPLGFEPEETITETNMNVEKGEFPYEWGTAGVPHEENGKTIWPKTKTLPGRKKERWIIVTQRKPIPPVRSGETGGWEYTMIKKENASGVVEKCDPMKFSSAKMHEYLGARQITIEDFQNAINSVKPVKVKNARKLLEYTVDLGRPLAKANGNGHDIDVLAHMAQEEQLADPNGSFSQTYLDELVKRAENIVKGGYNGGQYTFDNYIQYMNSKDSSSSKTYVEFLSSQ